MEIVEDVWEANWSICLQVFLLFHSFNRSKKKKNFIDSFLIIFSFMPSSSGIVMSHMWLHNMLHTFKFNLSVDDFDVEHEKFQFLFEKWHKIIFF
jgi:hypothetical protein